MRNKNFPGALAAAVGYSAEPATSSQQRPKATTDVTIGAFQHLVLLAIQDLGPQAYVAEIVKWLASKQDRQAAVPQVFLAVERLEDKRLIRSRKTDPENRVGGRSRRLFSLTSAGTRALDARLVADQAQPKEEQHHAALQPIPV